MELMHPDHRQQLLERFAQTPEGWEKLAAMIPPLLREKYRWAAVGTRQLETTSDLDAPWQERTWSELFQPSIDALFDQVDVILQSMLECVDKPVLDAMCSEVQDYTVQDFETRWLGCFHRLLAAPGTLMDVKDTEGVSLFRRWGSGKGVETDLSNVHFSKHIPSGVLIPLRGYGEHGQVEFGTMTVQIQRLVPATLGTGFAAQVNLTWKWRTAGVKAEGCRIVP